MDRYTTEIALTVWSSGHPIHQRLLKLTCCQAFYFWRSFWSGWVGGRRREGVLLAIGFRPIWDWIDPRSHRFVDLKDSQKFWFPTSCNTPLRELLIILTNDSKCPGRSRYSLTDPDFFSSGWLFRVLRNGGKSYDLHTKIFITPFQGILAWAWIYQASKNWFDLGLHFLISVQANGI